MANYRVYFLDGHGRIQLADWIEAQDDHQAIIDARKLKPDAQRCEIWLQTRLVAKLNSDGRFERVEP